ncbi:ets DNA-binding protein pokkuri isoform X1 [Cloeon dipterum]|uniref:ets DNA-binding protein pokkuri isoform X1 n=2 Tax=Cloeon dipterum TaxID=197152 RepID=UPI00321FF83A
MSVNLRKEVNETHSSRNSVHRLRAQNARRFSHQVMMQTDSMTQEVWGRPPPADWAAPRVPPAHAPLNPPRANMPRQSENLPKDPRMWSREHVVMWLRHMASRHQMQINAPHLRFPMNGKALCLMNVDMFLQRVPVGGKTLYKDFQLRLSRAMYLQAQTASKC